VAKAVQKTSKKTGKKYFYDPEAARARRQRIMEAAIAGGYVPRPRRVGAGITERRTSKSGKPYFYTPWSKLTPEQKAARLEYARRERQYAKAYKEEHGIGKAAKG
jgi:hypothetical protein